MAWGEAGCVSVPRQPTVLGSNSLIDLVVFGALAALHLADILTPNDKRPSCRRIRRPRGSPASTGCATLQAAHDRRAARPACRR